MGAILTNLRTIMAILGLLRELFKMFKTLKAKAELSKAKSDGYHDGLQAAYGEKLNPGGNNGPLGNPGPGEGFGGSGG